VIVGGGGASWPRPRADADAVFAPGSWITCETLVVDGGHWLYKPPMLPREMVSSMSRQVEGKSRAIGAPQSKL
jgi:peroxisomal 2,4-dienoyl-CoA reductase